MHALKIKYLVWNQKLLSSGELSLGVLKHNVNGAMEVAGRK